MISTLYTITNKAGDEIVINDHVTDPSRIIALQAYPQFDVDIKNNEISREGQHGIWDFYSYYGRRTVGFQGVIVGDSEEDVEAVKNQLLSVLIFPTQPTPEDDGYVFLTWTDLDGNEWEIECKLMNSVQFNRNLKEKYRLDFNFTLKASDPFILSADTNNQFGTRGYTTAGGHFPLAMPAILGTNDVNILTVTNNGLMDAHTIIRIYGETDGAITNPVVRNLTTGKEIQLDATIATEDDWIEIDTKEGTVVDQDGNDLSGAITGDSEFILLKPGANQIVYMSDEDPSVTLYFPSASFSVSFRNTKI